MDFKVIDFNAKADGITNDGKAIEAAIKACVANKGGRVVFSKNHTFASSSIILYDNVELYFEEGSKLIASKYLEEFIVDKDNQDYCKNDKPDAQNGNNFKPYLFFIYAKDAKNIKITGKGFIDGNEEVFYGKTTKYLIDGKFYPRMPLIFFENCEDICVNGLNLQRSAFSTILLVGCKDIDLLGLTITNNLRLANSEGIVPDHCQNITIKNCKIFSADDCIVFKTTRAYQEYGDCCNIEVANCTLVSTSSAIKFGTQSVNNIFNAIVHDCRIINTNRGISIQLRDEGMIADLIFKHLGIHTRRFSPTEWWGKAEPIAITAVKRRNDSLIGSVENVTFEDIFMDSENGIFIFGDEACNIKNVSFKDITLDLSDKTRWSKNLHDLRPAEDYQMLEVGLAYVYARNAINLSFTDYSFTAFEPINDLVAQIFDVSEVEDFTATNE